MPERVFADPMRLRQVLTNLLCNATKFTDQGEVRVRVGYLPEGEAGELRGRGGGHRHRHRRGHLEQIFEDFVQADESLSRRAGGTGLGLAICRQLAGLMGGAVSARSVPGDGLDLPLHRARAPGAARWPPSRRSARRPARQAAADAGAPRGGPRHQPVSDRRLPGRGRDQVVRCRTAPRRWPRWRRAASTWC